MPTKKAVTKFLAYSKRFAPNTQRRHEDTLRRFLAEMPQFLDKICPEHIDKFIMRPGLNNNSRNVILSSLRSFYKYLEDFHELPNTADKVKYLRPQPSSQRVISYIEYRKILECTSEKERAVIRFLANTGLRAQEFCDLTARSIAPDFKYITVIGKGSRERTVPLNYTARQAWPNIFYKQWSRDKLTWLCRKLADKAGIPRFGPHALRHYWETELIKKGVPISLVAKIAGHSVEVAIKIYSHISHDDILGLTDCLDS